jgi:NAD(P)H-dependent FMN reductase
MKKIIAFAGSSSQNSINKKLATYAAHLFQNATVEVLDLNDYEMPIYSTDREKENGVPQLAIDFFTKITQADILVVSLAEHNGAYTTAFKNVFDWVSRHNNKL